MYVCTRHELIREYKQNKKGGGDFNNTTNNTSFTMDLTIYPHSVDDWTL